jgi:DNA polymerase-3 subunit gamma/tau
LSKLALYQKYRSADFDEVVGQEVTVRTIKNAIRENKVGHAYLFCGPRGTGKTTMARLLAKAVNCEHPEKAPCGECDNCRMAAAGTHPDIIEINAANETHVEDVRDLIERARLAPMVGKHKVYIIDEVHQLSSAAASALLKTLEEPPENVIFILATTDPQKLLPTIVSRCQRFNFFRIRTDQIQKHLLDIAEKENIQMDEKAALKIAQLANGGMRDALSIMDQCASFCSDVIREEDVDQIYGLTSRDERINLLNDIFDKNVRSILERIKAYEQQGIDFQRMIDDMIDILKDAVVFTYADDSSLLKVLTPEEAALFDNKETTPALMRMINTLLEGKARFKYAQSQSSAFEVTILDTIVSRETISETQPAEPAVEKPKRTVSTPIQPSYNMPAQNSPAPVQEEKQAEPAPMMQNTILTISENDLLGMMQISDKTNKAEDQQKFGQLDNVLGIEAAKYKNMLRQAVIVLSGPQLIVFAVPDQASADRINSEAENRELYQFLKDQLNIDKRPYAVTNTAFHNGVKSYVAHAKDGTLPPKFEVESYQEKKEETTEEKVLKLFGEENVDIV